LVGIGDAGVKGVVDEGAEVDEELRGAGGAGGEEGGRGGSGRNGREGRGAVLGGVGGCIYDIIAPSVGGEDRGGGADWRDDIGGRERGGSAVVEEGTVVSVGGNHREGDGGAVFVVAGEGEGNFG